MGLRPHASPWRTSHLAHTTVSVAAGTSDRSVGFLKGASSLVLGLKMAPKPRIVRWVSAPEPAHGSYCSRDATIVNIVPPFDAIRDHWQGKHLRHFESCGHSPPR